MSTQTVPARPRKRRGYRSKWKAEVTVGYVPLPPGREYAYWRAWRHIFEIAKELRAEREREQKAG